MPITRRLAHVCIFSTDLAATERFYCQGLGLTIQFEFSRQGQRIGYYLGAGGETFIEVFHRDQPLTPHNDHPIAHFCLEVDSIDATIERLKTIGVECSPKTMGADHSWQSWLTDPSGIRFELHEYTDRSCQRTGEVCVANW